MKAKKGISVTLTRDEARSIIDATTVPWTRIGNMNRYRTLLRALNKLEKALEAKAP